jgi:hypothetical protein
MTDDIDPTEIPGPPDPEDGGGPDVPNDVVAEPSTETDPEAETAVGTQP